MSDVEYLSGVDAFRYWDADTGSCSISAESDSSSVTRPSCCTASSSHRYAAVNAADCYTMLHALQHVRRQDEVGWSVGSMKHHTG